MNKVTLIGNLTRDAKVVQGNTPAVLFTLAINEGKDKNGNDRTSFIPCRLIGKAASSKVVNYLTKGKKVAFSGHLDVYNSTKEKLSNGYPVQMFNVSGWEIELVGPVEHGQMAPRQNTAPRQNPQQNSQGFQTYNPQNTNESYGGYPGQVSPVEEDDIQF